MQGGVLSRAYPSLILSSKSLVMRNVDEYGRENFGVQQFPLFNLLEPEELDWEVCLSWLEGKRGLDTRVPVNLHSSKYSWGYGLKDAIWRWYNFDGDGLKDAIQECLLNCNAVGQKNEYQNGIRVWNALELYLETEFVWAKEWRLCLKGLWTLLMVAID